MSVHRLFLGEFERPGHPPDRPGGGPIDLTEFVPKARQRWGVDGAAMATELLDDFLIYMQQSPWGMYRQVQWENILELSGLFQSEELGALYGRFIDQRFIDYLSRNFGSIDAINWRKFEGLTAEFMSRAGLVVEIGPGRNDDNIDIRAWPEGSGNELPPTLLVQCKREKRKVGKVVVKALWADVVAEGAKSGLIVTTTALSAGARKVCSARAYPVREADRGTLKQWIDAMRTPDRGIFLGE